MKQTLLYHPFLLLLFFPISLFSAEPKMANVNKLLAILYTIPAYQAYVVPDADRETIYSQVIDNAGDELPLKQQIEFGRLKGDGAIDNPEEYFTAIYILKDPPKNQKFQTVFSEEFPSGIEGYARLIALWHKTAALERSDYQQYNSATERILKAASKTVPSLTAKKALEYYQSAIKNEIKESFSQEFTKKNISFTSSVWDTLLEPWYNHFSNPSESLLAKLHITALAFVIITEENPDLQSMREAYDSAVKAFEGDGNFINFESDREYYRSYTEELESCKASIKRVLKR